MCEGSLDSLSDTQKTHRFTFSLDNNTLNFAIVASHLP